MTQISRMIPNRRVSTIEFYLHRLCGAGEQTTSVRSEASYGNPTLPDSNPCHPRNPWLAFRPKIRVYSCLPRRSLGAGAFIRGYVTPTVVRRYISLLHFPFLL